MSINETMVIPSTSYLPGIQRQHIKVNQQQQHPAYSQHFSIPENIVFYISKHPSTSKVYKKLIESCKYFYFQRQVILFDVLNFFDFNDSYIPSCEVYWKDDHYKLRPNLIDLNKIKYKIWLTNKLEVYSSRFKFYASSLTEKIYRCDLETLVLRHQALSYDEFELFTCSKTILVVDLVNVSIKYSNGDDGNDNNVPLDVIVKSFPNVQKFRCEFGDDSAHSLTHESIEKFLELPHFPYLQCFELFRTPEIFDFTTFLEFMKKYKKTKFCLYFHGPISDDYKQQLQDFVDAVIADSLSNISPALVCFPGQREGSFISLHIKCKYFFGPTPFEIVHR